MEIDMEVVYGNEDYEELQEYFEGRKFSYLNEYKSLNERLNNEYLPDLMEEINEEKKDYVSNRRKAIRRISNILEEISPDSEESSVSEADFEGQK